MAETKHTPTPWFVSGVRFKMNGGEWQSINRYDEAKKQDENIACVGYDPRTGLGFADAHFIVRVANCHDDLLAALKELRDWFGNIRDDSQTGMLNRADAAISKATS